MHLVRDLALLLPNCETSNIVFNLTLTLSLNISLNICKLGYYHPQEGLGILNRTMYVKGLAQSLAYRGCSVKVISILVLKWLNDFSSCLG